MNHGVLGRRLGAGILLIVSVVCGGTGQAVGYGPAHASAPPTDATTAAKRAAMPRWTWPVGPPHRVVRPFEAPATRYSAGHRGIDLSATAGAAVLAPADGVVYFAGTVVDRPVLTIEYPGEILASSEPVAAAVAKGQAVAKGAVIGTVANGGHCADGCLHFGVRVRGRYVSPLLFVAEVPRAVLLPLSP